MHAVIQRVSQASVSVDGKTVGAIEQGFLVLVGVTHSDTAPKPTGWRGRSPACGYSKTKQAR